MNQKNRSVFPFRRGGGKKRSRNANRRPNNGGNRRVPNSAAELLPLLQPATKSVAQVIAGNSRPSGQVVHARNLLTQAERLVEERVVERMPPAGREEFLEQLARLKLTLADADEFEQDVENDEDEEAPAAAPVPMERLRALALSIAQEPKAEPRELVPPAYADPEPEPEPAPQAATREPPAHDRPRSRRPGETLRLKSTRNDAKEDQGDPVPAR